MSRAYPFTIRILFHTSFLYLSSLIFRTQKLGGLLPIAMFFTAWIIVAVLTWHPVVKPIVSDVAQHPLSYLAGLTALFWLVYIDSHLSLNLSDMPGLSQLWVAVILAVCALRLLILAYSAFRVRGNSSM